MAQEFKIKGLTSVDLKNGQKQEVEVEGIEEGKVLLAKIKDQIHAISPKCSHYGAPLAKGVLSLDGRLTCPWHGACFNVSTGDIEDAPALDPLAKFEVIQKDDGVYIKGEEATIKANKRHFSIKCQAKGPEKVIVVGGGSGSLGVVEGLRGGAFTGEITIISNEGYTPIDRTKLSKALLTDLSKLTWRGPDFYKDSVEWVDDEVTAVDFKSKSVTTKSGKTHSYTKLVLSTGGTARWLPLEGLKGDLGNVFVLRTLPDTEGIVKALGEESKKVVVIGSSFIGMEVGNCLASKKHQVSIIGMEKAPMERVMGENIGRIFRGMLEKTGITFYMNASVEKATPSKSDPSKVGAVHLKDGTVIEADVVIEGVGVAPATQFLKSSTEVQLLKDGSLKTNESFEVEGLQGVYAIGDIATYPYHGPGGNGHPVRIEHWNVAQTSGRAVAKSIISPGAKPEPFIPVFWSALGSQLRYCGNTMPGSDDVVVIGETDPQKALGFIAYYTKGEEVVAVASMNKDPYMVQSAELMRTGAMPSKSELQKGADIMQTTIPA